MHHNASEVIETQLAGPFAYGNIAKSLKSKMWLERFDPLAFGGIANGLLRPTQIFGVEVSSAIEYFCMAQDDRRARRGGHAKAHASHHVLSHINHGLASGSLQYLHWFDLFNPTNRGTCRRHELRLGWIEKGYTFPVLVVKLGLT